MTEYYGILLLLLAVIQDEVKGYFGGFVCSVVAFTNQEFRLIMELAGYTALESTLVLDSIALLLIIVFCQSSKVYRYLLLAFTLSLIVSLIFIYSPDIVYSTLQPYYGNINIILFEIMVMGLFIHSTIYPKLKTFCTPYTKSICDFAKQYDCAIKPITRKSHDTE
jgi:hypothetical protein